MLCRDYWFCGVGFILVAAQFNDPTRQGFGTFFFFFFLVETQAEMNAEQAQARKKVHSSKAQA